MTARKLFWRNSTFLTGLVPLLCMAGGVMAPALAATEREWRNIYPDYSQQSSAAGHDATHSARGASAAYLPDKGGLAVNTGAGMEDGGGFPAVDSEGTAPSSPVSPFAAAPLNTSSAPPSTSVTGGDDAQNQPVDLVADSLSHDEATQTVVASGNVELVQAGRRLSADSVSYDLGNDRVRATGNVVLIETDGTVYRADDVELTDDMKDGFVEGLKILLTDGSRFTAESGTRTDGTVLDMKRASYTPCELCKEDPTRRPLWQLRAGEVRHDEESKTITYRDAWFEFAGVPLMYTPYFSHPDGSEKQKSGLLLPRPGYDSSLGLAYQQSYYWAIAPDRDATIGTVLYSEAHPVALAEYRQRFENASFSLSGSATYSERKDEVDGGGSRTVNNRARGHLFGSGQWDMNDKWRSGFDLALASDEQYMRQYDIDSDDVLENEIYAERFSGRNYAVGRVMGFQDIRTSVRRHEQPSVLPEVIASFYGDPNAALGGRWNARFSALGLHRQGSDQDMGRASAELGWQRRYVTGFGLVNTFDALLRGDAYQVHDRDSDAGISGDDGETLGRAFAQANWEMSYPFVRRFESAQMVVEPVASFTAGTNVDHDKGIPNEDSRDFTLDTHNLFKANRAQGYDLIEDRTRVTYGVRTGLHGDNGYRGEVFVGQSRRLNGNDNPFSAGSGLSDRRSDYVGQVSVNLGRHLSFDYRTQLRDENFASRRHEFDGTMHYGPLTLGTRYFYASGLTNSDLDNSREQIRPSFRLHLNDEWSVRSTLWYDLGENSGLRRATYGFDYEGQCFTFGATAERRLTRDYTGDADSSIMFRIGLKNLGTFETSGINLGTSGRRRDFEDDRGVAE